MDTVIPAKALVFILGIIYGIYSMTHISRFRTSTARSNFELSPTIAFDSMSANMSIGYAQLIVNSFITMARTTVFQTALYTVDRKIDCYKDLTSSKSLPFAKN